ncbi:MAG: hypothetical protein WEF50_18465 [Myxococcota bacterium]
MAALAGAGVEFVLVGVGAINFYARDPAHAFATLDVDVLLAPRVANLRLALRTLAALDFRFESGGEPFLDVGDEAILATIVGRGATLCARHPSSAQLDLMVAITGFTYAELASDAIRFRVSDSEIPVGRLAKLLRSKQLSGRAKDRAFLEAFEARADDDAE